MFRRRGNHKRLSWGERLRGWFARTPKAAPLPNRTAERARRSWNLRAPLLRLAAALAGVILPMAAAGAAFLVPVVGVQAYHYVMQAEHFQVREVLVDGNRTVDYETIRGLCGLDGKTHLLATDLERLEGRLEAHPWIADAEIERQLPGRLIIRIREQEAAAYAAMEVLYLVNPRGEIFAKAEPERALDLPIITGIPGAVLDDGAAEPRTREAIRVALHVARLHADLGLATRWPIAELRVQPGGDLTLVLSETGTEAVLGKGPYREKLYRLEWVLEHLLQAGKQADYVLLDGRDVEGDDGRVVVKADLAPTQREQRERARDWAERARERDTPPSAPGEPHAEGEGRGAEHGKRD